MATATAPAKTEPAQDWDDSDGNLYTSPPHMAAGVAWNLLTHSTADAADIALVMALPRPEGLDHEDMWQFVWELVGDAARIGYLTAKVEPAARDCLTFTTDNRRELSTVRLARAIAALVGQQIIEGDTQPGDE